MGDIVLVASVGFAGVIGTGVLSSLVLGWLNARSRIREKDAALARAQRLLPGRSRWRACGAFR